MNQNHNEGNFLVVQWLFNPEYSLEGLMLKLKLEYFGYLMGRTDSFEKTLILGKGGEGNDRGWDGWMASPMLWTWVWVSSRSWWWTGKAGMLQSMGFQRVGRDWVTEQNKYYVPWIILSPLALWNSVILVKRLYHKFFSECLISWIIIWKNVF